VIPNKKVLGGAIPFAFTESGVSMISSVLNSPSAVAMNIAIMRTFVALRKIAVNYKEIKQLLEEMRGKYDAQFEQIYKVLEQLINPEPSPRRRIGFKSDEQD
jgi:hypothetical protein